MQSKELFVKSIILRDNSYLKLIRPDGLPDLPGGRVEQYEGYEQALFREITEETGLMVEILYPIVQWSLPKNSSTTINGITYLCHHKGGSPILSIEHSDCVWEDIKFIGQFKPSRWMQMKGEGYEIYRRRAIRGICGQYARLGRHY